MGLKRFLTLLAAANLATYALSYDFHSQTTTIVNETQTQIPYTCELYYSINPDKQTVTVVQGPDTYKCSYITIPETVEYDGKSYTVTAIGSSAFAGSQIYSLSMANTITEVMSEAFDGSSVKFIDFSHNLKHIRERAFIHASNLVKIVLYEGLESIGEGAFEQYYDSSHVLGEVMLPNSLQTIGDYAFANQRNLKTVKFPDSKLSIGQFAFSGCELLDAINLPEQLVSLDKGAFYGCSSLKEVIIPEGIIEIASDAFRGCLSLSNVLLPESLVKIGDNAFSGCAIKEFHFPASLDVIGAGAFFDCRFEEVVLPDHIKMVGSSAFALNHHLIRFTFSKGMKSIDNTVSGCEQLIYVEIPEGITYIGYMSFSGCTRLSSIKLPESLTEIDGYAFSNSGIQKINFPAGLEIIPCGLFSDCKQLTSIIIPATIKTIEERAFYGCSNLSEVVIAEGIETIGQSAFESCSSLEEVVIPSTVKSLGYRVFENCSSLKMVKLPQSLETINSYMFYNCVSLQEITIPENVTAILNGVFFNCMSMENIFIPSHVETIGIDAFSGCNKLKSIILPSSVQYLAWRSFENCSSLTEFHINRAIPPMVFDGGHNSENMISPKANTALFVPRGSKTAYVESGQYNNFSRIEEEDVDGTIYFRVRTNVTDGYGMLTVNESNDYDTEVAKGENAVIKIEPVEGWLLKSLICNGYDVTNQIVDGIYSVVDVEENYTFEASFIEAPVNLTIKMGNGGFINTKVQRGQAYIFEIVPDEGWKINSLLFNDIDVTTETVGGFYTTPELYDDAMISVSFEITSDVESISTLSNIRANITTDGTLLIDGVDKDELITVMATDGKKMNQWRSSGNRQTMQLPNKGVYIVHVKGSSIKISY